MNLFDPYPVNCIFIAHDGSFSSILGLSFFSGHDPRDRTVRREDVERLYAQLMQRR